VSVCWLLLRCLVRGCFRCCCCCCCCFLNTATMPTHAHQCTYNSDGRCAVATPSMMFSRAAAASWCIVTRPYPAPQCSSWPTPCDAGAAAAAAAVTLASVSNELRCSKCSACEAVAQMKCRWAATWPCDRFVFQLLQWERDGMRS
jgi:hypothetical protein